MHYNDNYCTFLIFFINNLILFTDSFEAVQTHLEFCSNNNKRFRRPAWIKNASSVSESESIDESSFEDTVPAGDINVDKENNNDDIENKKSKSKQKK